MARIAHRQHTAPPASPPVEPPRRINPGCAVRVMLGLADLVAWIVALSVFKTHFRLALSLMIGSVAFTFLLLCWITIQRLFLTEVGLDDPDLD